MTENTSVSSTDNNNTPANPRDNGARRNVDDNTRILYEYTESRIRPANTVHHLGGGAPTDSAGNHDVPNISELPFEQREAFIEEVTDSLRKILIPVTLCLASVVIVICSITFYSRNDGVYLPYTPFHEDGPISNASKFGHAIANSLIIIGVVVAMTFLLVLLYYCNCYKIIHGWLIFVSFMVLFMFSGNFILQVLEAANWSLDYISFVILLYNFGIVGLISIHWKSPLRIQQFYLITTSVLMSLIFIKYLPEWTSWVFLIFLATYDIIAVLCPGGPLKMLINIVQEKNQPLMPALIYSSMVWVMAAVNTKTPSDGSSEDAKAEEMSSKRSSSAAVAATLGVDTTVSIERNADINVDNHSQIPAIEVDDDDASRNVINAFDDYEVAGVKLGLGDFIFYSVLIGKAAASGDLNTVYACTLGILTGLSSTLILLAVSKHALPALPISIALGVIFYFTTFYSVSPMITELSKNMMFL